MPNLKDLKNRIESVKSTRKITKAMQMVAAAKLRRAQGRLIQGLGAPQSVGASYRGRQSTGPRACRWGLFFTRKRGHVGPPAGETP